LNRSSPPITSVESAEGRLFPETVPISAGSPLASPRFRLGRTPVTNLQYAAFLASGRVSPPPWWSDPRFASPAQPVVGVSWDDAVAFCDWLTEAGRGRWRLPTEAEWELAMCGGRISPPTPWGDAVPAGEIPEGPLEAPWETGRGTPNAYGLLDPGTVVHEWCLNRSAGGSGRRASKGGSWRHAVRWSAPGAASSLPPDYRYADYGFRVLLEAPRGGSGAGVE
jgi:formylglycine-generating enzyme required for sulfatase activity